MAATPPVPLTILTGFLGAGKTTLLNRILHGDHGLRVAVLVNDFGAINIDAQLVVGVEEDTINLSNGCICCTIRDDFLNAVVQLIQRPDPPEYIVVETSGVSDPIEIALTFKYIPQVRIDSILTVIDAEQILETDQEYPILAMNQIGMADVVVLNKVDLVDADQLEAVRRYVRGIIKDARILETTFAVVPLELVLGVGSYDMDRAMLHQPQDVHVHAEGHPVDHDHEHHHHSLVFSTWNWTHDEPVSLKALRRAVNGLPPSIFRAKGIFLLADQPDQPAVLHVVGRRVNLTFDEGWQDGQTRRSQVVMIGAHDALDAADLRQRFDACLASEAKSDLEHLFGSALSWLRGKRPTH